MSKATKRKNEGKGRSIDKKSKSSSPAANSKRALKQERQSHRKHADAVIEAKRIWNQLRLKNNKKERNRELMDELIPLIKGKANEIALQHDASRVIQAAIQFGTMDERRMILQELCAKPGNLVELAKSQYAHFCVLKVIKYCHTDDECVKLLGKALKGHIPKLAVHAVGSRSIESLFLTLSPKQTAVLKQEFYGPHFALFASDTTETVPTLASNIDVAPDKKEATLEYVRNLINKCMEKSLYGFTYFQELFAEYCAVAESKEIRALASSAADHVIHLLSTRAGTRVAAYLIAYGTAKDRKRIMKCLKGYVKSGLLHHDGYLAILRLVQLTDDTVSIHKNILNEILTSPNNDAEDDVSPLLEIALSDTGSKLILMLLIEDDDARRRCFDPYELSVLVPNPTVTEDGHEVPTSKKENEVRRKELMKYMKEPLIELCCKNTEELLRSLPGSIVLREVYAAFHPDDLVQATIKVCKVALDEQPEQDSEEGEEILPLFEDRVGHLAVKHLLLADAASESSTPFASAFLESFEDRFMEIASSNRGAFVVEALCKVSSLRKRVIAKLDKSKLKKLAGGEGATAGFKALLKEAKKAS